MNWSEWIGPALTWLAALATWVWAWTKAHKDELAHNADQAIGIVQKYKAGASESDLEVEAICVIADLWPDMIKRKALTGFLVRAAVREACKRRRENAEKAGLRKA